MLKIVFQVKAGVVSFAVEGMISSISCHREKILTVGWWNDVDITILYMGVPSSALTVVFTGDCGHRKSPKWGWCKNRSFSPSANQARNTWWLLLYVPNCLYCKRSSTSSWKMCFHHEYLTSKIFLWSHQLVNELFTDAKNWIYYFFKLLVYLVLLSLCCSPIFFFYCNSY